MDDRAADEITYRLGYRDVVEILKLVRESERFASFELELGWLKLKLERGVQATEPARAVAATPEAPPADEAAVPAEPAAAPGRVVVRAPVLGTFYRAPAPGAPSYVEVGDTVGEEDTIGLIEVMKLFTPIPAGAAGRVAEIVAANAALVEYGEALIVIEPLGEGSA